MGDTFDRRVERLPPRRLHALVQTSGLGLDGRLEPVQEPGHHLPAPLLRLSEAVRDPRKTGDRLPHLNSGLLANLAGRRLRLDLSGLEVPLGERALPLTGRERLLDEQHAAGGVEHDPPCTGVPIGLRGFVHVRPFGGVHRVPAPGILRRVQPAVFLDRDDTLIDDPGDLHGPDQVTLRPGVAAGLRALRRAGYRLVVVTNQGGVGRGRCTEEDVDRVHRRIAELVDDAAGEPDLLDRFYYCPYHPDAELPTYRRDHFWRKPRPGMLLQAARDLEIDLGASWMIGDRARDVEAGRAAGCRTILLGDGHDGSDEADACRPTARVKGFADAAREVLRRDRTENAARAGTADVRRRATRAAEMAGAAAAPAATPAAGVAATPAAAPARSRSGDSDHGRDGRDDRESDRARPPRAGAGSGNGRRTVEVEAGAAAARAPIAPTPAAEPPDTRRPHDAVDTATRRAVAELIEELRQDRARDSEFGGLRLAAGLVQLLALTFALLAVLALGPDDAFFRWMAGAGLAQGLVVALLLADGRR